MVTNRVLQVLDLTRSEATKRLGDPIRGLLGTNPKVAKGEKEGYATFIMHLAPSVQSGYQVCPMATEGCKWACLNASGHGRMMAEGQTNAVQVKRVLRTLWFFERRKAFMARLVREVELAIGRAERANLTPVFRLNGTSDIRWETVPVVRNGTDYPHIFDAFPDVQFYDYTKIPNRRIADIDNYSLTFSLADGNEQSAFKAVQHRMNLAVVFRYELPESFTIGIHKMQVIDGDVSDLRFLDDTGVVVGLTAKGYGDQDDTGFVKDSNFVTLDRS